MAKLSDSQAHWEVIRTAQATCLPGMQASMMARLKDGDYRGALLLCRRALALEDERPIVPDTPQLAASGAIPSRSRILDLLEQVNALRLRVRTHTDASR